MDGEDDVADVGHISGRDEADGTTGDGNGSGGDEDNYGYNNHVDDSDDANPSWSLQTMP